MNPSRTEENYLKAIYKITEKGPAGASTNAIAERLNTKAATVTDMVKRLSEKQWVSYQPYQGASLTPKGTEIAIHIVRKHRLWEVFLVNKLGYSWDQIHDLAEELEHIQSADLINRLDAYLGYPSNDPHGDPIPNQQGQWNTNTAYATLSQLLPNQKAIVVGVLDHSQAFLQHLTQIALGLGTPLMLKHIESYDQTFTLVSNSNLITISIQTARNLLVEKV